MLLDYVRARRVMSRNKFPSPSLEVETFAREILTLVVSDNRLIECSMLQLRTGRGALRGWTPDGNFIPRLVTGIYESETSRVTAVGAPETSHCN
jgi:hypothetical protein